MRLRLGLGFIADDDIAVVVPTLTDVALSAATIAENSAQNAAVGTLSASGGVAPYVFTLVDNAGSRFQVTGTALQAGSVATNFEGAASHNITVRVTDAENQTLDEVFAITVTAVNEVPTDIAWAGSHSVAEDAALGTVVGGALSFSDPDAGETGTFSLTADAGGYFAVSGTSIIVTGVLDFETAASHNITVRFTDAGALTYDEVFAVTVTDVSETAPPDPPPAGTPVDDGTFTNPPVLTTVSGAVKLHGKKAAGAAGKFIYDIGAATAGYKYTMLYDPDWSLLGNGGVTAMVGFGLKQGQNFRLTGLKGDGAAGLKAYEIHGTSWNSSSGHTTVDGGAAQHGVQAGPNWVQFQVSDDGATYTARTSSDGTTWADEFTAVVPTPHSDVDGPATFGIAVYLEAADSGSFSVQITLWTGAPVAVLDGLAGLTGAWSMGRKLVGAYAGAFHNESAGDITSLNDQTGNSRHFTAAGGLDLPIPGTAGANSRACAVFDGVDDTLQATGFTLADFINNNGGYIIFSGIVDAITTNHATIYNNDAIFADANGDMGFHFKSAPTAHAFSFDTNADVTVDLGVTVGSRIVVEWKKTTTAVLGRVNMGTWQSQASGNIGDLTKVFVLMRAPLAAVLTAGKIFEGATFDTVQSTEVEDALATNLMNWPGA